MPFPLPWLVAGLLLLLIIVIVAFRSFRFIGAAEVGLVNKRVGARLTGDQAIAFAGEAVIRPSHRTRLSATLTGALRTWTPPTSTPAPEVVTTAARPESVRRTKGAIPSGVAPFVST